MQSCLTKNDGNGSEFRFSNQIFWLFANIWMIFYRYWQFLPLLDMFHVPRSRLWLVHVDMKARNLQIEIMKLKMLKLTNLHLNKVLFPFPPLLPMTDIWNYCYFLSLFCQLYAELGNFPRYLVIFTQNLGIFKRNSANFMRF